MPSKARIFIKGHFCGYTKKTFSTDCMKPFLLLDKSSERIGKFLENLRKAPDIQLYRAIYDQRALKYGIEVVEMTNDVLADENVYYGAKCSRWEIADDSVTGFLGFVISIPRHGVYFSELLDIAGDSDELAIKPPNSAFIWLNADCFEPLVVFFRGKTGCCCCCCCCCCFDALINLF